MCPRQAQILAVTDVRLDGKSGLVVLILPFFFMGTVRGYCQQQWKQKQPRSFSNDDIKVIMHCGFVWAAFFLSVEEKWYIIKQNTYIMKEIPKALKQPHSHLRAGAGSKGLSHDICLEDQLTIYVSFWRGTGFCQTQVTGHQAEVLW